MIDTRRSTTPGIWEPTDTKSLSERLRNTPQELAQEAADALDAKDAEIERLQRFIVHLHDIKDGRKP
jgi:sialic acid synthase SpsE